MKQDIFEWLKEVARNPNKTKATHYEDGYSRFGYDANNPDERNEFHVELCECSKKTHREHGFMISVLIVNKATGMPGPGFFDLARHDLGKAVGPSEYDEIMFTAEQLRKTLEYYQKQ